MPCPEQRRYRTHKSLRRTFRQKDPAPRYLADGTPPVSDRVATLSLAPDARGSPPNRYLVNAHLRLRPSLPEWQRLHCRSTHPERTSRVSAAFAPLFADRFGPKTKVLAYQKNRPQRYTSKPREPSRRSSFLVAFEVSPAGTRGNAGYRNPEKQS